MLVQAVVNNDWLSGLSSVQLRSEFNTFELLAHSCFALYIMNILAEIAQCTAYTTKSGAHAKFVFVFHNNVNTP